MRPTGGPLGPRAPFGPGKPLSPCVKTRGILYPAESRSAKLFWFPSRDVHRTHGALILPLYTVLTRWAVIG